MEKNLLKIRTKRDELFVNWQEVSSTDTIQSYLNLTLLQCNHFSDPVPDRGLVNQPPSCRLCSFQCELQEYQSLLNRSPRKTDFTLEEVWLKSWTETMLDVLHRFAQKNKFPASILTDAKRHIGQFCDLQNEIRVSVPNSFHNFLSHLTLCHSIETLFRPVVLEMVYPHE